MSSYEFYLSDVTFTNGSDVAQINNSDSVFGAIPESQVFIEGFSIPETLASVDNDARTITLNRPWPRPSAASVELKISPSANGSAQLSALTATQNAFTAFNASANAILSNPNTTAFSEYEPVGPFTERAYLQNQITQSANGKYYYCITPYTADENSPEPENDDVHWYPWQGVADGPTVASAIEFAYQLSQFSDVESLLRSKAEQFDSLSDVIQDDGIGVIALIKTTSYHGVGNTNGTLSVGGNTYLKIEGQAIAADGCRYIHTDDGNTLVGLFPNAEVTVEQAGALGHHSTYAGDKISVANAVAIALRYKLVFTAENYNCGTDSFIVDGWRAKWEGRGGSSVRLYWDAAPSSGYAIRIIGENVYEANDRMTQSVFSGIALVGGAKNSEYNADAIQLSGGTSETRISCCSLDWVSVQGFKRTFRYNDHCWKVHLNNCRTIGGVIETPASAVDFGECMVLRDCFIADSSNQPSNFRRGEWQFHGTSFDNVPVHAHSDAILTFNQSHLENPNNSNLSYKFLVANGKSKITVRDSWISTNNRAFVEPPLTSNVSYELTSGEGGIFLDNVTWNMNGDYNPRGNGYPHNYLIGGDGRCGVKSINWLGFQPYWGYPTSRWSNQLGNGDFETGDDMAWQVRVIDTSGTGAGDAQLTVVTDSPYAGTYCGKFSGIYGGGGGVQGGELYQSLSCTPGDFIVGGLYLRNDWDPSGDAGLFQVITYFYNAAGERISFLDQYGNPISSYVHQKYNSQVASWSYRHIGLIAPKGAAYFEVCVQVLANNATPTTVSAWVDELHIDVQRYQ